MNRTDRDLVVPRNCYYCVPSLKKETLVAPISPRGALLFLPQDYLKNSKGYYAVIENPEDVGRMNVLALKYEYMFNGAFIASNHCAELEILQEILNEHKAALEALRQETEAIKRKEE